MIYSSREPQFLLTIVLLHTILVGLVYSQYSICQSMQYRALSIKLQNEHQCMIIEKLQEDFNTESDHMRRQYNDIADMIKKFQTTMVRHIQSMTSPNKENAKAVPVLRGVPLVRDCTELYMNGVTLSGVYPMRLPNRNIVNVWCDMDTSYGGWTVIQKRMDGSVNFTRYWDDYAFGFGNVNTEYWLGNDNIYWITSLKNYTLRIDLWDWEDNHVYAVYDTFLVESEKNQYRLKLGKYSGTAGDAMTPYHNNMYFSTIDADNDEWNMNCALKDQSGWWFRACGFASLNGLYIKDGIVNMSPDGLIKGIIWYQWKNDYRYSMKRTEMKIKPFVQVKADRKKMVIEAYKTKLENIKPNHENGNKKEEQHTTTEPKTTEPTTTEATTHAESTTTESVSTTTTTTTTASTSVTASTTANYEYDYDDDFDYSEKTIN